MSDTIYPVLLCGGSGTRLWPVSRQSYPKQFSALLGGDTLFQASARRTSGAAFANPLVVTSADLRFIVREQLAATNISPTGILVEPEGRNTAAAILAAALWLKAHVGDVPILVTPSDHVIPEIERFHKAILTALKTARSGEIITFGIQPDRPETGYGYLELATPIADLAPVPAPLHSFVEKPDVKTAMRMLSEGRYLWNAGIFLFTVNTLIAAFETHAPDILTGVREAVKTADSEHGFIQLAAAPWCALPNISIDYAVMEKAKKLAVQPYGGKWSDLGDWDAVWREMGPNEQGVVEHGSAIGINCENTLLRSESPSLHLVGIGLKNVVAVAMPDAVLIADKGHAQDVKLAVSALIDKGAEQAKNFPRDHRPWGWAESLVAGDRFRVKRIVVHPGASLDLQSRNDLPEHWIVVNGTARVTAGNEVRLVTGNHPAHIMPGVIHRIENSGKTDLALIEVQIGSDLGQDNTINPGNTCLQK